MKFQADIRHNPASDQYEITFSNFPEWLADVFTHYTEIRLGSTQHHAGADPDNFTGALHITAHRPPPAESKPIPGIRKGWVPADDMILRCLAPTWITTLHNDRKLFIAQGENVVVSVCGDDYIYYDGGHEFIIPANPLDLTIWERLE